MDLYLLAHCEFFIGDTSGIKIIPQIFKKPCVVLNLVGCGDAVGFTQTKDIMLFKKIWSLEEKRYLNLGEINNIGDNYSRTDYYLNNELELLQNTPEEIKAVVLEMASKIRGDCDFNKEDEKLQERFKVQLLDGYNTDHVGRLGCDFLKQNKDWFLFDARVEPEMFNETTETMNLKDN
jgi:putative glycosyltransferase (TIGR04372 family)